MLKFHICKNISRSWDNFIFLRNPSVLSNNLNQSCRLLNTNQPKISKCNDTPSFHPDGRSSTFSNKFYLKEKHIKIPTESEQDFLVKIKNDPDSFGASLEPDILDEGDILEEKHFTEQVSPGKRLTTKQYADLIKSYIRKRKIKEAIDVLEVRMLKDDKVKPEAYIYNLLLGACGRVGYTKKAFMLYNQMKKRGLKATGGTYTALFNACANSPWPLTDGLTRAKHLYDIMIEKGDQPNDTNYNVMIKTFGRCGDLPFAFQLVDEMFRKGLTVRCDTINFLLQACVSDKDAGFRHSLLVWRKAMEKGISPDIYTFNLLLRCVRDTGLGDLETSNDVILKIVGSANEPKILPHTCENKGENFDQIGGSGNTNKQESKWKPKDLIRHDSSAKDINLRPNLLDVKPHLGNILSLSEVTKPEDKLLLLGGSSGFLDIMLYYRCTPDIKTFTQLLECIPSTTAAEKELVKAMKKLNVTADIDFYNMLIKKKSMRFDYEGAKEVLISMKQMKYRPDLVTYGVLALGCKTKEEAQELITEMKFYGYTLNSVILGAMLKQACFQRNFPYIFEVMDLCLRAGVPVNKKFLEHLKVFKEKCKASLEAKTFHKKDEKLYGVFQERYRNWVKNVQIDDTEDAHPWQQYRQNYSNDVKYVPKDTARFKQRHISKFKVKTSKKHLS